MYDWFVSQYGAESPALTRIAAWLGDALLTTEPERGRRLLEQAFAMQGGEVTTFGGARTALFIAEAFARVGDGARARPYAAEAQAFFQAAGVDALAQRAEAGYTPSDFFERQVARETRDAWKHGGRTVRGSSAPPGGQLGLFDGRESAS